jgi:hypothetical protein
MSNRDLSGVPGIAQLLGSGIYTVIPAEVLRCVPGVRAVRGEGRGVRDAVRAAEIRSIIVRMCGISCSMVLVPGSRFASRRTELNREPS